MKALLLAGAVLSSLRLTALAGEDVSPLVGVWKVNWEKAPEIKALPDPNLYSFKTVEEFRDHVTKRAKGLVLEIQNDKIAFLQYQDGKNEKYTLGTPTHPDRYDVWLQTRPHFLSWVTVGHGFKLSDANTAVLTFQLDWNEDVATRVPLVMERVPPKR